MKKLLATVVIASLAFSGSAFAENHKAKMKEVLSNLPPEKAEIVKKTLKDMREQRKANRDAHKAERDEMKALMTAPSFDKSAFVGKAEALAEKRKASKVNRAKRIADVAEQLNQEERKLLMDALPKKGKKGKRGGKKRD